MTQSLPAPDTPLSSKALCLNCTGHFSPPWSHKLVRFSPEKFCNHCSFSLECSFPRPLHGGHLLIIQVSARTTSSESFPPFHSLLLPHNSVLFSSQHLPLTELSLLLCLFLIICLPSPTPLNKYLHENTDLAWLVHSGIPRAEDGS